MKANLNYLSDPSVFEINREPAISNHKFYNSLERLEREDRSDHRILLNGTWKFKFYERPELVPSCIYDSNFDIDYLNSIAVPAHLQLSGYDQIHYTNTIYPWDGHENISAPQIPLSHNATGIYFKDIIFEESFLSNPCYIQFDGVEVAFYLFINGEFVGYSEDSFTPSRFDISKFIHAGTNRITVQVQKFSTANWLEDQDFWRFSGIFRDVYIYHVPKTHLEDIYITHDLYNNYKQAKINLDMKFIGNLEQKYFYVELLFNKRTVFQSDHVLIKSSKSNFVFNLNSINLWSDEDPNLYDLRITILDSSKNVISVNQNFIGLREFKIDNKVMKLNGKRIVFKGVNRHEFNHVNGRVVSEEDMLWDIEFLKTHNFNAVRTSHYPNNQRWYELCDQHGIMLIDEANLESHGTWQKFNGVDGTHNVPGNMDEWHGPVLDRAVSMFERDKNHPSIVIWSCGNESYAGTNILAMAEFFREKDPRRVVQYEGVFWNREYNNISDIESRMYAKVSDIISYLEENPDKPFINCEYSHAMGNSCGNIGEYTDLESKYELYQGGFIWDYIDQGLEKNIPLRHIAYGGDFDDRPTDYNFCINGIINANRTVSPKVQEVKKVFEPIKVIIDGNNIKFDNRFNFTNLNKFTVLFQTKNEDQVLSSEVKIVNLQPNESLEMEYEWYENQSENILINTVSIISESVYTFENKKNIIAFGQEVKYKRPNLLNESSVSVVNGDGNISFENNNMKAMFHKQKGLVSLRIHDEEILNTNIPKPQFVRAQTDNDKGNRLTEKSAYWFAANFYTKVVNFRIDELSDRKCIHFDYLLLGDDAPMLTLSYIFNDKQMIVEYNYTGANKGLIPMHAIIFELKKEYNKVSYLGMGPHENYVDRNRGGYIDKYHFSVSDNISEYLIPQEYGNRTNTHSLSIKNEISNNEFTIKSVEAPFEFKALPHSWLEIESKTHQYELSNHHYTYLTIAGKQMGVGGDDSWGAPVLDNYLIDSHDNFSFSFIIEAK